MSRRTLPNRRAHEVVDVEHDGQRYTLGVGWFDNGNPAEIFLTSTKIGTAADVNARDVHLASPCCCKMASPWTTSPIA